MTITSGELINAALRKCGGVIAEGETPSAELSADSLQAFNTLLDSWSAETLSIFSTQDQVVTWSANQAEQTFGPSGDLVGLRPVRLDSSTYFKDPDSDISYPLFPLNESQYNSIALKTSTSTYPEYFWINMTMPDVTIKVYPIPNKDLEFHIVSAIVLAEIPDLFTDIALPPGYRRALIFNLACEICPELGIEPPQTTQRIALTSKRVLKSNNSKRDILEHSPNLLGYPGRFNIYSGGY